MAERTIPRVTEIRHVNKNDSKDLTWLKGLGKSLEKAKFYGEVHLKYYDGKIVAAHKHESLSLK